MLVTAALAGGCAWQTQSRLDRFNAAYRSADFVEAVELAGRYGGTDTQTGSSEDLLWTLQQASALQAAGDHVAAARLFDTTERFFKVYDAQGALSLWGSELLSVVTNDAVLDYQGTVYDAIMVNSYKALNFLAEGEPELARVELNRARDRQRRAAEYFAEELVEARHNLLRRNGASTLASARTVQQALDRADVTLAGDNTRAGEWSVYPDFINPFPTYLEGLFLMTHAGSPDVPGDFGRAADALAQARAMVPDQPVAQEDWRWAEDLATGRRRIDQLPPTVWVLYENGLGPERSEQRIQLPIVLFNRNGPVFWSGIAYPLLKPRSLAQPALRVRRVWQALPVW